jgi:Secretion system C-terminal sorting domain
MKQIKTLFRKFFAFASFLILPFVLNAQIIFQDDFTTDTLKSEWTLRPNLTGRGGTVIKGNTNVFLGKERFDNDYSTNCLDLKLNLSNKKDVKLSFYIMNLYNTTDDSSGIYLSNDGGLTFKQAFQFKRAFWSKKYGQWGRFSPSNLDKLAQLVGLNFTKDFIISFRARDNQVSSTASNYSYGIYISDVKIYKDTSSYISSDFYDNFESPTLKPAWSIEQIGVQADWNNGNLAPYHEISKAGGNGTPSAMAFQNSFTLGFGRPQGSALDLHLNLLKRKDVALSFMIKQNVSKSISIYPLLQGIYFSDNGGRSFKQIFEFQRLFWEDNIWCRFPPFNIDKLAHENGLVLSDSFIVRFQSLAIADSNNDQFFIGDVNVTSNKLTYAALPFSDNFKGDTLKSYWRWSHVGNGQSSVSNGNIIPNGSVRIDSFYGTKGIKLEILKDLVVNSYNVKNAVDLHLNLKNQNNVKLSFRLLNLGNDSLDFLFLSNDGGHTFKKIASINFTIIENNKWLNYDYNLSDLAQQANLTLTDSSIIRFQQIGNRSSNGIYIANIQVKSLGNVATEDILELKKFQIAPNPNKGYFTVLSETTEDKMLSFKVLNIYGQIIYATTPKIVNGTFMKEFDLSIPIGLYFLYIVDDKGRSVVQKFIIH